MNETKRWRDLGRRLQLGLRVARQLLVELLAGDASSPVETPRVVPIGELRGGELIRVVGVVRCFEEPELIAPLSGRRCAYYRTKLFEADEQRVLQETGSQSFFIADDSGEALVKIDEPEVTLAMDAHVSSGMFSTLSDGARSFLARHGRKSQKWLFERDIRFEEGIIEPGETVAITGHVRPARGSAATFTGYRSRAANMVIEGPPDGHLHITDIL